MEDAKGRAKKLLELYNGSDRSVQYGVSFDAYKFFFELGTERSEAKKMEKMKFIIGQHDIISIRNHFTKYKTAPILHPNATMELMSKDLILGATDGKFIKTYEFMLKVAIAFYEEIKSGGVMIPYHKVGNRYLPHTMDLLLKNSSGGRIEDSSSVKKNIIDDINMLNSSSSKVVFSDVDELKKIFLGRIKTAFSFVNIDASEINIGTKKNGGGGGGGGGGDPRKDPAPKPVPEPVPDPSGKGLDKCADLRKLYELEKASFKLQLSRIQRRMEALAKKSSQSRLIDSKQEKDTSSSTTTTAKTPDMKSIVENMPKIASKGKIHGEGDKSKSKTSSVKDYMTILNSVNSRLGKNIQNVNRMDT